MSAPLPPISEADAVVLLRAAMYSPTLLEVARERLRQIEGEDWSAAHDDTHTASQLSEAGICYLTTADLQVKHAPRALPPCFIHKNWPWDRKGWKVSADQARNRIKGLALGIAEGDRLKRAALAP